MDSFMQPSVLYANCVEFHYEFEDQSHSMNALVFNKCEGEVLAMLKELSQKMKISIEIETEPIEQGGLRSWLKLKGNSKEITIKDLIMIAAIGGILSNLMSNPLNVAISEIVKHSIELLFEDDEITELKKQKEKKQLQLDVAKLEEELKRRSTKIDENVIIKRRSNYYSTLKEYPKVTKVSVAWENEERKVACEYQIDKNEFENFVLDSDELEPVVELNAVIEIVSPVLKKGKYKWTGIYNGEVIQFKMKSIEFKTLVQSGTIVFKNGFTFECELAINRKMTNEGEVRITSYEVLCVNRYYDNNNPVETPEGRRKRKTHEAEKLQLTLFDENY